MHQSLSCHPQCSSNSHAEPSFSSALMLSSPYLSAPVFPKNAVHEIEIACAYSWRVLVVIVAVVVVVVAAAAAVVATCHAHVH